MQAEALIVGAGVAGLSCARELRRAGLGVTVVEKSRGVGGRCATRRVGSIPVDHGLTFYHGSDPEFMAELRRSSAHRCDGWPRRVLGRGRPCQPRAFGHLDARLAFRDGMTVFPKALARDLDVRLETRIEALEPVAGGFRLLTDDGASLEAEVVVVALPPGQARALLETTGLPRPLRAVHEILRCTGTVRCLTVLAGYADTVAVPDWDIAYPEESTVLQVASHDSSKRGPEAPTVCVYQSSPVWAAAGWQSDDEHWAAELLAEAGRLFGSWAAAPSWYQTQRWRHCRTDGASELAGPVLLELAGTGLLGLAGEVFAPGGGVQAAWASGRILSRRITAEVR